MGRAGGRYPVQPVPGIASRGLTNRRSGILVLRMFGRTPRSVRGAPTSPERGQLRKRPSARTTHAFRGSSRQPRQSCGEGAAHDGEIPILDPTDASGTVVKLKSKVSALAVVAFDEVDEQLTRQKHGHVGERVNEVEVDVVDFNLGESKLDDSFGTNEGGIWPTGGEGRLVWPTALRE